MRTEQIKTPNLALLWLGGWTRSPPEVLPTTKILRSSVCVGVCKYGLSTEWVLWRSNMEYVFAERYRGQKRGSLLQVIYRFLFFFLKTNTWISMENNGKKNASQCVCFSQPPQCFRSYFGPEPARSEMLSPYSCPYPLPGFILNTFLSRI